MAEKLIILVLLVINLFLFCKYKLQKKKTELMYQRSICDGMTGLYNHTYIINRLKHSKQNYSLLMIDIDDFKEINDTYGHQVGDKVIKRVAEQIKDNIRKTDLVGRYGGDEFLVAFRDCERPEELEVITKKIKRKIADLNDSFEKIETEITVSAGIHIANNSFEEALSEVDNCLYSAKDKGTDNLVINAE